MGVEGRTRLPMAERESPEIDQTADQQDGGFSVELWPPIDAMSPKPTSTALCQMPTWQPDPRKLFPIGSSTSS
jgi:hypothetical protein